MQKNSLKLVPDWPPKGRDLAPHIICMLETLNSLQTEPQRADLSMRHELISCLPRPVFICCVGTCGFISRQLALIAWHNAFNYTIKLEGTIICLDADICKQPYPSKSNASYDHCIILFALQGEIYINGTPIDKIREWYITTLAMYSSWPHPTMKS